MICGYIIFELALTRSTGQIEYPNHPKRSMHCSSTVQNPKPGNHRISAQPRSAKPGTQAVWQRASHRTMLKTNPYPLSFSRDLSTSGAAGTTVLNEASVSDPRDRFFCQIYIYTGVYSSIGY